MSWDLLPSELGELAVQLLANPATERTGQAILTLQGAFEYGWRTNGTIVCGSGIPLPPPRNQGLSPLNCEVSDANLCFTFRLGPDFAEFNLPERADFQVCVIGLADYGHAITELQDHWRVDSHDFDGDPVEPHPYIHFQRGGHAQDSWAASAAYVPGPALPPRANESWQGLLQSPGPRIPFPPLCPLLAIDFVLGQHDGNLWRQLRNSPEYLALIQNAQARLWTPFFEGLRQPEHLRKWLGTWMT